MEKKIRVLFLAANPKDTVPLDLDEEMREIQRRIRGSAHGARFEFAVELALRPQELPGAIMRHKPDIIHFSGHGGKSGEIILINDATKDSQPVSGETLAEIFRLLTHNIRCVVLNACYAAVQAQAIAKSIPCVVGMSRKVLDDAAIAFAAGLYEALAFGENMQTAFDLGRTQMALTQNEGQQEQPKISKCEDVDLTKLILVESTPTDRGENPWATATQPATGSVRKQQKVGNITITGKGNKTSVTQNDTFGRSASTWVDDAEIIQEIGDVSVAGWNHETTINQNDTFAVSTPEASASPIDMIKGQALAMLDRVLGEIAAGDVSAIKKKNIVNTASGLKEELAKQCLDYVSLEEYLNELRFQLGGVPTLAPLVNNLAGLVHRLKN